MKKIILASKSPRRKKILEQVGLNFEVMVSDFDETKIKFKTPQEMVEKLSLAKAKLIAKKNPGAIIIGADTTVIFKKEIIGKPKSKADAFRILRLLSGNTHEIVTGFTVIKGSKSITKHVISKVKFKKLSNAEIKAYVATGEPMDKAGGYGIQEKGGLFMENITGDYFNVVGLPIFAVAQALKQFGVGITKNW
ncbi:MAG TPA: Maf family protein [Patescibacteria group bacterium]|jgi:septum formation protein|nr:Maf family protein [Patescibacteria group bacterium]